MGGVAFLLAVDVGEVALTGLCLMCSIVVLTGKVGMRSKLHSKQMMGCADKTIGALRELVDGSKVVKFQVRRGVARGVLCPRAHCRARRF